MIDKKKLFKGWIGEHLVTEYLESEGYVVYKPPSEGAHAFDRLCVSKDKRTVVIAEVKTKPARLKYPDTGINIRHYNDYLHMLKNHNIDTFLFFVDENRQKVYGNRLSMLIVPRTINFKGATLQYPMTQLGIVYFPLEAMVDKFAIENDTAKLLKAIK